MRPDSFNSCASTLPKTKRSILSQKSALRIAKKLGAEIKQGRRHPRAIVRIGGAYVGVFGVRRGRNTGHDYIPQQIHTSMQEAIGLDRCHISKEDYVETLRRKNILPASEPKDSAKG